MAKSLRCYDLWALTPIPSPRAASGGGVAQTPAGNGWVAEWLKAPVLKTGRGASPSWVRIPPHPPTPLFRGVVLAAPIACADNRRAQEPTLQNGGDDHGARRQNSVRETFMTLAHLLPRWALHRSMLILVVSFLGFIASGAAAACCNKQVGGTCSGGGQLCNTTDTFNLPHPGPDKTGEASFTPGPLTCSDLKIHFFVDGTEVNQTGFVGPGGTTAPVSLGVITTGNHVVGVKAEGEVGGCNSGTLVSWAGTVHLQPQ